MTEMGLQGVSSKEIQEKTTTFFFLKTNFSKVSLL